MDDKNSKYIVVIGASSGGLAAWSEVVSHCGCGFFIVMHLSKRRYVIIHITGCSLSRRCLV